MTTRAQFIAGPERKLADAQLLLASGSAENAYYLAGYAVEFALKAVIATRFTAEDLPDRALVNQVHTHNLSSLLKLAGLESALRSGAGELQANWGEVGDWSESSRYQSRSFEDAEALLEAIRHPQLGVLAWLKTHW